MQRASWFLQTKRPCGAYPYTFYYVCDWVRASSRHSSGQSGGRCATGSPHLNLSISSVSLSSPVNMSPTPFNSDPGSISFSSDSGLIQFHKVPVHAPVSSIPVGVLVSPGPLSSKPAPVTIMSAISSLVTGSLRKCQGGLVSISRVLREGPGRSSLHRQSSQG